MMRLNNIFEAVTEEAGGFPQGTWTTIIRMQGCNLLCSWCDSPKAQDVHALCYEMEIPSILKMIRNKHVLITGGEPMIQEEVPDMIKELQRCGHTVQVETNGGYYIFPIPNVHWVVDRKTPSSGMSKWMLSLEQLYGPAKAAIAAGGQVYLKWAIKTEADVDLMLEEMEEISYHYGLLVPFIVSPVNSDANMIPHIVEKVWEKNNLFLDQIIFSIKLNKFLKIP